MRQKSHSTDLSSEEIVKGIRGATRNCYSAEEKIRIVLDGLPGEHSIAEVLPSKALPRASTTAGRKSSSKPASGGLPARSPGPPPATKSKI